MITKKDNDQRNWRVRMLLLHGTMLVAPAALLVSHSHFQGNTLGLCILKALSGVDCPACGVTHSVMALFSGRIREAFCIHPAGPVILGIVGLMTVYLGFVLITGHKGCEWRKEAKAYSILDRLAIGVLLAGWVGRLMTN